MGQWWFSLLTSDQSGSFLSIDESEGVYFMYHELGETSQLIRGLIFGIRPSIAWRLGMPLPPLDNLTSDGQLGWQVGLRSIVRRHERQPDRTPESVIAWLNTEVAHNQRRQIATIDVIESLRACLPSLDSEILAMSTDDFVTGWKANLAESVTPRRSGTESRTLRALAADTIRQLAQYPGTESLAMALYSFGDPDDLIGAFETRPGTAAARLHPPLHYRQDWLDVLAEVNVTSSRRARVS